MIIINFPECTSLSPTLFDVYMAPLATIVQRHMLNIISYTDDNQMVLSLTRDPTTTKGNIH